MLLGRAALRWRSRPAPSWGTPAVGGVVVANCLTHLAVSGDLHQTTTLMLAVVGIGAAVPGRRSAAALVSAACAGWAAVVLTVLPGGDPTGLHYPFQLAMASLLAAVLHAVRRQREGALVRAGAELTASEQRFRGTFAESPVGMALTDGDGRFTTVNAALCALLGRPEHAVLGSPAAAFTHEDDRQAPARTEQRWVRPDGEVRWAWVTRTALDAAVTLVHVQDVTERRATQQVVADSAANLAAVSQVVRGIRSGEDPRTSVLRAVRRIAGASSATLLEPHGDGVLAVTRAEGRQLAGTVVRLDEPSATAHVWRTGEALLVGDTEHSPLVSPALRALSGARSMLWQPVLAPQDGTPLGVLAVTWDQPGELPARARRAVALLADETGVALRHDALLSQYAALATTDPLTGLPNRRAWDARLPQLMATAERSGGPLVVAIADLDHFKAFNDAHGHVCGDALLRELAQNLRGELRAVDLAARWGGEEFVLALPGCSPEHAADVLARVRACVPSGQTLSVGCAVWQPGETPEDVLGRADVALYAAKALGRDTVSTAPVPAQRTASPSGAALR